MLYTKLTWNSVGLTDMLAPVAKFQLTGERLIVAMPYESLTASLAAAKPGAARTVATLASHMLSMSGDDFSDAGGMGCRMKPGDFIWIPGSCVVAEFNLVADGGSEDDIHTSLSWVAMTSWECQSESIQKTLNSIDTLLAVICEPSQKTVEHMLQALLLCVYAAVLFCSYVQCTVQFLQWFVLLVWAVGVGVCTLPHSAPQASRRIYDKLLELIPMVKDRMSKTDSCFHCLRARIYLLSLSRV